MLFANIRRLAFNLRTGSIAESVGVMSVALMFSSGRTLVDTPTPMATKHPTFSDCQPRVIQVIRLIDITDTTETIVSWGISNL